MMFVSGVFWAREKSNKLMNEPSKEIGNSFGQVIEKLDILDFEHARRNNIFDANTSSLL